MLEWLGLNERLLNVQRLKTINSREDFAGRDILTAISNLLMKPSSSSKWTRLSEEYSSPAAGGGSLFLMKDGSSYPQIGQPDSAFYQAGYLRSPFKDRKKAVMQFNPELPANMILKLRALFGLNSRCEVIAWLHGHPEGNATEIASATGYSAKTVYNTLLEMHLSGMLGRRTQGRETLYRLEKQAWSSLLNAHEQVAWLDWPKVFRALETIWFALSNPWLDQEAENVATSELRLAFQKASPKLLQAGHQLARFVKPTIDLSRSEFDDLCDQAEDLILFLTPAT
jgi:hypothetical protein